MGTLEWHSNYGTLLCYNPLGSKEGKWAKSKVFEMRTWRLEGLLFSCNRTLYACTCVYVITVLFLHWWCSVLLCPQRLSHFSVTSSESFWIQFLEPWFPVLFLIHMVMLFQRGGWEEGDADIYGTHNLAWQLCGWPFYPYYSFQS